MWRTASRTRNRLPRGTPPSRPLRRGPAVVAGSGRDIEPRPGAGTGRPGGPRPGCRSGLRTTHRVPTVVGDPPLLDEGSVAVVDQAVRRVGPVGQGSLEDRGADAGVAETCSFQPCAGPSPSTGCTWHQNRPPS